MCAGMSWSHIISSNALEVACTEDINVSMENEMKRLTIVVILSLVLMSTGQAQQHSLLELSLSSGYVLPTSPMTFAQYWKMQEGGSVSAGIALSPSMSLLGSVEYYRYALNVEGIHTKFDTKYMGDIWGFSNVSQVPTGEPSSILTVSANVRVVPTEISGMFSPYFLAGGGVMMSTFSEISLPTTSTLVLDGTNVAITAQQRIIGGKESSAFVQGGIGIDACLSDLIKIFVEARFALGMSKSIGTAYVPLTGGVRLQL